MKRLLFAATAVVALGVPMAAPAFADPPRYHRDYDRHDRNDRHDRRPDKVVVVKHKTGDRIGHHNSRYREVDYRAYRLNDPPRGYHYVKDDNTGEIILAAIATGIIAAIIAN